MWLKKARTDIRTAKKLFREDERILDTSVYHTQQCAEKALKGFLAFKKQPIHVISREKCPCFGSGGCPFSVDVIKV